MNIYTLGFAFYDNHVALVRKTHGPAVNHDRWNGIGGKLELDDASFEDGMSREFEEETGMKLDWEQFGIFAGEDFQVYLFKHFSNDEIELPLRNDADEELLMWNIREVLNPAPDTMAQNLPTMVAHALSGEGYLELIL